MSASCCHQKKFDGVSVEYKRALVVVIILNGLMFFIEMMAGITASSQSLKADALDFLGDATTYSISLAVIGSSLAVRAKAALFKGISLGAIGIWVLFSTLYHVFVLDTPQHLVMGVVGTLALVANLASLLILLKFRDGDANVRSVWLCTRNDSIGNVAVVIAAAGVWGSGTAWPDLLVAVIMSGLFISSAIQISRQSLAEMAEAKKSL